jgi:hypothetical protein
MKTLGEWRYKIHLFLPSALNGREWSVSCPRCFNPGRTSQLPLYTRLGEAQRLCAYCEVENSILPLPRIELRYLGCSVRGQVAILTEINT